MLARSLPGQVFLLAMTAAEAWLLIRLAVVVLT